MFCILNQRIVPQTVNVLVLDFYYLLQLISPNSVLADILSKQEVVVLQSLELLVECVESLVQMVDLSQPVLQLCLESLSV